MRDSRSKENSIFQRFEIREILRPSHRTFVSNQSVFAQHKYRNAVQIRGYFSCKRVVRGDTCDARQQIDSIGRAAELNHLLWVEEVSFVERLVEAELSQKIEESNRVLVSRADKDIKVAGVTRTTMKRQAVRPDDDVLNAAGVE